MSIDTDSGSPRRGFPTTHASILEAAASADEEVRRRGFGALVSVYWKPVYTYLRLRWGHDREMAKDLTQDFFTEAMTRGFFESYDPARARFRTFVRSCVDHFAANARRAEGRLKRGGGAPVLSLDFDGAEAEFARARSITEADAETRFQQEWMRALLSGAVDAFRAECTGGGREDRFRLFERYDLEPVDGSTRPTYNELAEQFALPLTQVTNHLAWARREFRRHVLATLRALSGSEAEFRAEARELLGTEPP